MSQQRSVKLLTLGEKKIIDIFYISFSIAMSILLRVYIIMILSSNMIQIFVSSSLDKRLPHFNNYLIIKKKQVGI